MSFSDRPSVNKTRMVGCWILSIIIFGIILFLLMVAALGHCVPQMDGSGCENSEFRRMLMFPGSLFLGIGVIVLLARWAMKDPKE